MLHGAVHWQKGGAVADLTDGVKNFILTYLYFPDVYLIFDRYHNYSIKSNTRAARGKSITHGHILFRQSSLLSKGDKLSCTKSKVQLREQISAGLLNVGLTEKNCLVITSNDHCPTELKDGKKNFLQTLVKVMRNLTIS